MSSPTKSEQSFSASTTGADGLEYKMDSLSLGGASDGESPEALPKEVQLRRYSDAIFKFTKSKLRAWKDQVEAEAAKAKEEEASSPESLGEEDPKATPKAVK